jgi:glycosyl transferase family 25
LSIRAVVLSLPKDVQRRRFCEAELTKFGVTFEFSDAIPGHKLDTPNLHQIYDTNENRTKFKRPLSLNEVACTLGHRQIWQKLLDSGDSVWLVLEDDATFVQDPRSFLDAMHDCSECFEGVMIKLDGVPGKNVQVLKEFADQDLVLSDRLPPRTTGYIIGRKAAAQLLEIDAPIARPVDIDLKFYWEHRVPILTLAAPMISEREALVSSIDHCRKKMKPGSPLLRFARNLVYQAKYTHGRLSHPLYPDRIEGLGPLLRAGNKVQRHV